jgi:hypothetical protein
MPPGTGKPGSKGLGMGGKQTTIFASFARAPQDGAAPPKAAPPAAPKQAKLGFSASNGTGLGKKSNTPGPGLFAPASARPEKKKVLKQGRLGQSAGAASARPSSEDCIILDDAALYGPHKASSSHNRGNDHRGNGGGDVRPEGGLLAEQERKRKQVLSPPSPPPLTPVDSTRLGLCRDDACTGESFEPGTAHVPRKILGRSGS